MMAIYGPLQLILNVVYFMMIIHIIMSWLINFQVLNLHQPLVAFIIVISLQNYILPEIFRAFL